MAEPTHGPPAAGSFKAITSLANPTVKAIRALSLAKHRKESGLFIGEGLKLATDALQARWPVRYFVFGSAAENRAAIEQAAATARARGAEVLAVSQDILAKISRRDNPQTVIGVFAAQLAPPSALEAKAGALWVGLESVRDPGNLGTIIRTVDALGASGVILIGDTVDPFSLEAVRATMGSLFHVKLVKMSADAFLALRRGWGGRVTGTHLSATLDCRKLAADRPAILLMGGEQAGLSERLAAACDDLVKIPMAGAADSLNLAVATGIMLYEMKRQTLPPAGGR